MAEPNSEICIVVTHYNKGRLLDRAISSILNQNDPLFHVVVIDDASSDVISKNVFIAWREKLAADLRFRFLENETNLKASASLNRAIASVKADIIMSLDADDELPQSAVAAVRDCRTKHPEVDLIFGNYLCDGQLHKTGVISTAGFLDPAKLAENYCLLGTSPFARSAWLRCGKFDASIDLLNDMDFYLRLVMLPNFRGIYMDTELYNWHFSQGGKSRRCNRLHHARIFFRNYRFFIKNLSFKRLVRHTFCNALAIPLDYLGVFEPLHKLLR